MTRLLLCIAFFSTLSLKAQPSEDVISKLRQCVQQQKSECEATLDSLLKDDFERENYLPAYELALEGGKILAGGGHYQQAIGLYNIARKSALLIRDSSKLEDLFDAMGNAFLYHGNLDSSSYYYHKAEKVATKLHHQIKAAHATLRIAQIENYKGNSAHALSLLLGVLDLFKKSGSHEDLGAVYYSLGNYYGWQNKDTLAASYFRKSLQHYRLTSDSIHYGYTLTNISNVSLNIGQNDTAIKYLPVALAIFKNKDQRASMNAYAQLGKAYFFNNEPEKAIKELRLSNHLAHMGGVVDQLAFNHQLMVVIFRETGQLDSARQHANLSLHYHQQYGRTLGYLNILEEAMLVFQQSGDYKRAYELSREYINVKDSLFSLEKQKQIAALREKYEARQKEDQIKLQEQKISLLDQKSRLQSIRSIALGLVLFLVLIIAIGIISRQRTTIRLNRKIASEQDRALRAELRARTEEEKNLKAQLDHKKRELTSHALLIAEKNEMLRSFRDQLHDISEKLEENTAIKRLGQRIEYSENRGEDWDKFMAIFEEVHPRFLNKLQEVYASITPNDLRLLALMRMNFSNKEIATILHISDDGLKKARYRLRKKLELASEENMHEFIQRL